MRVGALYHSLAIVCQLTLFHPVKHCKIYLPLKPTNRRFSILEGQRRIQVWGNNCNKRDAVYFAHWTMGHWGCSRFSQSLVPAWAVFKRGW